MNDHNHQTRSEKPLAAAPTTSGKRRRLITAAGGGVGVLLSVSAKTALGNTICQSPSAAISGNMSPRPGDDKPCSGGRSPGFWVQPQHFLNWAAAGATPPRFNGEVVECTSGLGKLKLEDITDPGTLVNDVLLNAFSPNDDPGIWAVLAFPTQFDNGQLMRHLIAAWLNAGTFPDYPLNTHHIEEMWASVKDGGFYCPSSVTCGDLGWSRDDVIFYIENTYKFPGSDLPNLCKKND